MPEDQISMARDLFSTIRTAIGNTSQSSISFNSNFYQLGGNSLNSIFTIAQLRKKGYLIEISDFVLAKTLGSVLAKMGQQIINNVSWSYIAKDFASTNIGLHATALLRNHKNEAIQ